MSTPTKKATAKKTAASARPRPAPDIPADVAAATDRQLVWLYDTEQPDDALVTSAVARLDVDGYTVLSNPLRTPGPSVTLVARGQRLKPAVWDAWIRHVITAADRYDAARVRTYNGPLAGQGTIVLDKPAGASLRAAADRLAAGCPTHTSCRGENCTWRTDGLAAAIEP